MCRKDNDVIVLPHLLYKIPRIDALTSLNKKLADDSSTTGGYLGDFLKERGVHILLQVVNNRIQSASTTAKLQFKTFDIAILYECMQICKLIISRSNGIEQLMAVSDSITTIAKCLNFQCKVLSLIILDLLTTCSNYSIQFATAVYKGIQVTNDFRSV